MYTRYLLFVKDYCATDSYPECSVNHFVDIIIFCKRILIVVTAGVCTLYEFQGRSYKKLLDKPKYPEKFDPQRSTQKAHT